MPLTTEEKLLVQLAGHLQARSGGLPDAEMKLAREGLQGFHPEAVRAVDAGDLPLEKAGSVPAFPLPLLAWDTPSRVWPPLPFALPEVRMTSP
jgi:hypothetical protein